MQFIPVARISWVINKTKGNSSLDTNLFRFTIDFEQNPDDSKQVVITRTLILMEDASKLPTDFEKIFTVRPDEIVIPIIGEIDFDAMVEKFEDVEEEIGGKLIEDDDSGYIEYEALDGTTFIILIDNSKLIIKPLNTRTVAAMLSQAGTSLAAIAQIEQKKIE